MCSILVLSGCSLFSGEGELQPALFQSAPLRAVRVQADRVYLMSTQSETVITRFGGSITPVRNDYLYIELWAIDAATNSVVWRNRLRTYENRERAGRIQTGFKLLGVDGAVLWLDIEGPLGVSLDDGHVVADLASIELRNPQLAGRLVEENGYIAFGRNGLQLTLNDATQWRVDASDLSAAPRDVAVSHPDGITGPAYYRNSGTSSFQIRGVQIGERWLGVLTDKEADMLSQPPVVPGSKPGDRPGVMQKFLEENHVPTPLNEPLPQAYRLWGAHVKTVSAAPADWPKELPDNWGKRPHFSRYEVLPEAPSFLRAGLLREHPDTQDPLWYLNPDSFLVLHVDKLGAEGRLVLSRVSGPVGKLVWQATLAMTSVDSVMPGASDIYLWGREPVASDDHGNGGQHEHLKLARVELATGQATLTDMTVASSTRGSSVQVTGNTRN